MAKRGGGFLTAVMVIAVIIATGSAYVALQPVVQAARANANGGARSNVPAYSSPIKVDKGSVVSTVTALGAVAAPQTSTLIFQLTGNVTQVLVQQGQMVRAGQTLATIDDSQQQAAVQQSQLNLNAAQSALDKLLQPVDPNTVAVAEAAVKQAEGSYQSKAASGSNPADIAAAQAKVAQAQAQVQYAAQQSNGAGGVYAQTDPNFQLAQAQEGQATFNLKVAQLNLQSLQNSGSSLLSAQANIAYAQAKLAQVKAGPQQSDLDTAQFNVVSAQTQLAQAKESLAKTVLVAPYDGEITQVNLHVGQPSQSGNIVMGDLTHLYSLINVDETDIPSISAGQKVSMTIDALPSVTITGKVSRVYPTADATAAVITYPVQVALDPTTQPIHAGMTLNATFTTKEVGPVIRVPNNYIKTNTTANQTTATVNMVTPDGSTTFTIPVKTGVVGADYTEILQGLNVGDTIALAAALRAGGQGAAGGNGGNNANANGGANGG